MLATRKETGNKNSLSAGKYARNIENMAYFARIAETFVVSSGQFELVDR